jgi:hypothetical protein
MDSENKPYVNPFQDVHQKVQARKDSVRKMKDTEIRERNEKEATLTEEERRGTT